MGLCMICVRRVGARLGMVAWSVERESRRRVSSYRVVARGASCQGQPRRLPLLPTTSLRQKSDCQRRHKQTLAKWLLLVYLSLCSRICVEPCSGAKLPPLFPPPTPSPSLRCPSLFSIFLFPEFFLCAVALESTGCNYVHVN